MKRAFGKFVLIGLVVFIGVMLFLNYANYSDGYRAGVPIKISHKGKLFKTHEGELNEGGLTNTAQVSCLLNGHFQLRIQILKCE